MIDIKIIKKKVKRLSIKITPHGEVILTAPMYASNTSINNFIKDKEEWIEKTYHKVYDETLFYNLENNGYIYLLKDQYKIIISEAIKDSIRIEDKSIIIESISLDKEYIKNLFYSFLNDYRFKIYTEIVNKYLSLTNNTINKLLIKHSKCAYGKCYYKKRIIILNTELIHRSIDFIEYTILHEIAHLVYPSHNKDFYDYIKRYMSDYKIKAKRLKN